MTKKLLLFLSVALATLSFQALAADKQIKDIKELAGNWQGWVTAEVGDERATMIVQPDGSYKATTPRGTEAQGKFYLQQDGKLMYRSSRTAGKAILTEDGGKTTITILPEDPTYRTGSARYERVK